MYIFFLFIRQSKVDFDKMIENYKKVVEKYMIVPNVASVELYNLRWSDILTFGHINIDIQNEVY